MQTTYCKRLPDVYKRQQLICEAREKALEEALSALDALQTTVDQQVQEARQQAETAGVDPDAVSYTHLDVYKRQQYDSGNRRAEKGHLPVETLKHSHPPLPSGIRFPVLSPASGCCPKYAAGDAENEYSCRGSHPQPRHPVPIL